MTTTYVYDGMIEAHVRLRDSEAMPEVIAAEVESVLRTFFADRPEVVQIGARHTSMTSKEARPATLHTTDEARYQPTEALSDCTLDNGGPCVTCLDELATRDREGIL